MTRRTLTIKTGEDAGPRGGGWGLKGDRLQRVKDRAREARRVPTPAEERLWTRLAEGKIGGLRFSRKTVVGSVIVDFACPSRWVVVNLTAEGDNAELAALQDRKLADTGIRVLRFAEDEVMGHLGAVVDTIKAEVNKPFDRNAARRGAARTRAPETY